LIFAVLLKRRVPLFGPPNENAQHVEKTMSLQDSMEGLVSFNQALGLLKKRGTVWLRRAIDKDLVEHANLGGGDGLLILRASDVLQLEEDHLKRVRGKLRTKSRKKALRRWRVSLAEAHLREMLRSIDLDATILTERERYILRHRFELEGADRLSFQEMANVLTITRQRVYQILERVLCQVLERVFEGTPKEEKVSPLARPGKFDP
jgi:DNA-binding CsgD family transcriptional regulator